MKLSALGIFIVVAVIAAPASSLTDQQADGVNAILAPDLTNQEGQNPSDHTNLRHFISGFGIKPSYADCNQSLPSDSAGC